VAWINRTPAVTAMKGSAVVHPSHSDHMLRRGAASPNPRSHANHDCRQSHYPLMSIFNRAAYCP
jgi:hypothetical protein